jgi:hypothetical protein
MEGYKCTSCGVIVPVGKASILGDDIVCATCGGDVVIIRIYNEDGLTYTRSDVRYFNDLFPEEGPELCIEEGCTRKRIRGSIFCAPHEFQLTHNKPCPWIAPQRMPGLFKTFHRWNN